MDTKIDFVIPWVDGSDPNWQNEKSKYDKTVTGDKRNIRYRDLDNLIYWFRGVEKFAPWVNKIHFVTWGHLPSWLNTQHPKLNILYHQDFIPEKYLPTFNTRPIELNFHRIEGLSNHFVYFNDDMFIIKPTEKKDFFKKGLPCDTAVLMPLISKFRNSTMANVANVMEVINTTYEKNRAIKKNISKWFHISYGKYLLSTLLMLPYKDFTGFLNQHLPNSYLKSTYEELWEDEYKILDKTCDNKFRTGRDVNQQLLKYKQFAEGNFSPRSPRIGKTFHFNNNNKDIVQSIKRQKFKLICINDNDSDPIEDFEYQKEVVKSAFNYILDKKSSFEI